MPAASLALILTVATFAALALATAVGVAVIERRYPPLGRLVPVTGGHLHVLELSPGPGREQDPPLVLLHGASANLRDIRLAIAERLAASRRVILIDRPGHGWSDRPGGPADAAPARQAALVREALDRLGIGRAIVLGYSWSGALAAAVALEIPERVAGLVLVAPVTHPWQGGVAWYYNVASMPLLGRLFVRTLVLPLGLLLTSRTARSVFAPQPMPENYIRAAGARLLLRPQEFLANAFDVARLKRNLIAQAKRYGEIRVPAVVVTGDRDSVVSPEANAEAFVRAVRGASLVIVPGAGHMVHHLAPDVVAAAIESVAMAQPTPEALLVTLPREAGLGLHEEITPGQDQGAPLQAPLVPKRP